MAMNYIVYIVWIGWKFLLLFGNMKSPSSSHFSIVLKQSIRRNAIFSTQIYNFWENEKTRDWLMKSNNIIYVNWRNQVCIMDNVYTTLE